MTFEDIENPADPVRVIDSLGQMGYSLKGAISDLIDNSINAGASVAEIQIGLDPDNNGFFTLTDDGKGMDKDGLINALRYGSVQQENSKSLGKFGLGLKTASTSFSDRVCVISRPEGSNEVKKAILDKDLIKEHNKFVTRIDNNPTDQEIRQLDYVANKKSGTMIVWEKTVNMISYTDIRGHVPASSTIRQRMTRSQREIRDHLAMTFQRFLDPNDERARNFAIRFNGEDIEPWDPFCTYLGNDADGNPLKKSKTTKILVSQPDSDSKDFTFSVTWHILPRPELLDSATKQTAQLGPGTSTAKFQGIYAYRENRLVCEPNWLGTRVNETHLHGLRVDLSFDSYMDDHFGVPVDKSSINIDKKSDQIRQEIAQLLAPIARQANMESRKGNKTAGKTNIHVTSDNVINNNIKAGGITGPKVTIIDGNTSQAEVTNNLGQGQQLKLKFSAADSPMQHVLKVESLNDGVLWTPSVIRNSSGEYEPGVEINSAHPFYEKTWLTHTDDKPIIQAMDFLLWTLAIAEINNVNQDLEHVYETIRMEVSSNLRKLVDHLPEPNIE